MDTTVDVAPAVQRNALATLVVKDGVSLGGLTPRQRDWALALVWAGLPAAAVHDERTVNALLRAQLAGPAVWLATDHVELRRWLVDGGWLQRDGFGREYRRTPAALLRPQLQPPAAALASADPAPWVAQLRAGQQARRQQRHQAWLARPHAPP